MDPFRQRMFQACPPPFHVITAVWWGTQDITNRRHFVLSLVLPSLAYVPSTPPVRKCLTEHEEDLRHTLVKRRPALTNILHKILDHLCEHTPPLFRTPLVTINPWGVPQALYSTTRDPSPGQPPIPSPSPPPSVCV